MKKSNKISLFFCGAAFIIMIFYMLFVDGEKVYHSLLRIKAGFLLIAALCMCAYWLFEALTLHAVTKAVYAPQKLRHTFVVTLIGQYFNCITPFATGGQPVQAYYFSRYKVPLGSAMTALLSRFIVYQFTLTVYCFVLLTVRMNYFNDELRTLKILTLVGFTVNFTVILALLALAFFKNAALFFARIAVKLLTKIRIVKNYEQKLAFINEEMEIYRKNFAFLKKQPVLILKMFALTILQMTVYFSISFVIYKGMGLSGTDFTTMISCQSYVLMISSFVPLPGALGAAESSYGMFFGGIFGEMVTFSMFIWRFLTFYFPLVVGLCLSLIVDRRTTDGNLLI